MPRVPIFVCAGWLVLAATAQGAEGTLGQAPRVETGRRVYETHCASCHGAQGEGAPNWQQPDVHGELPAPPHDTEGHTWKHADGMLYRIVRDGWRDPFNKTERLTMPAFGQILSPAEIRAVIDYLETLWSPEQLRFQIEESRKASFPPEAG